MHIYIASKKKKEERKKKKKERKRHVHSAKTQESDQSFRCPHEESLGPYLPTERTSKTMTWLGGCWAKIILLV